MGVCRISADKRHHGRRSRNPIARARAWEQDDRHHPIIAGLPCCAKSDARHRVSTSGCRQISSTATLRTTVLSARYAITINTAEADRFLKSSEEDCAEERKQHDRDRPLIAQPDRRQGFSTRCAAASAAESVIVMMKLVAANPSSDSTSALPFHLGNSFSRIRMLPWPMPGSCPRRGGIGKARKASGPRARAASPSARAYRLRNAMLG